MDLSFPLSGLYFGLCDASFSSDYFDKDDSSNLVSFINSQDENDYSYILIFK